MFNASIILQYYTDYTRIIIKFYARIVPPRGVSRCNAMVCSSCLCWCSIFCPKNVVAEKAASPCSMQPLIELSKWVGAGAKHRRPPTSQTS